MNNDLISRQAVKDWFCTNYCSEHNKCEHFKKGNCNAMIELFAIPPVNSQEPCSDAISRQAVLEYIEGSGAELGHDSENELVCQDIKELPPVIPQPKTGHWIGDNQAFYIYAKCSECGSVHDAKSQYCPTCGCLMEYEEETE